MTTIISIVFSSVVAFSQVSLVSRLSTENQLISMSVETGRLSVLLPNYVKDFLKYTVWKL